MADRENSAKPDSVYFDEVEKSSGIESAPVAREIDGIRVLGLSQDDADFYASYTPEQRKRVVRKVSLLQRYLRCSKFHRLIVSARSMSDLYLCLQSIPHLPSRSCQYRKCQDRGTRYRSWSQWHSV